MISVTSSDLDALRHHAAYAPLTDRAFLRITGSDATRWLNGMVTNNIQALKPGEGNYNFLLNAQGRIVGDAMIYREPGEGDPTYRLETDNSQLEAVQQHLDKFIIMDDVELASGVWLAGIELLGPKAADVLFDLMFGFNEEIRKAAKPSARGLPSGMMSHAVLLGLNIFVLEPPDPWTNRFEIWCEDPAKISEVLERLSGLEVPEAAPEALEAHRILSGTPRYGIDIRNTETAKDLPQETAQTHALHFSKGCYLGQEIVERIHSRGQVHRTFSTFTLEGAAPTLPAPLTVDGKAAGELTSAVEVNGQLHALGYVRREFAAKPLHYDGGIATAAAR